MAERKHAPRIVVLGDLVVDVVLAPQIGLLPGTDVPGRVMLRQGGSGTTTARWLGRSGARVALVGAVGRDAAGRALVRAVRADGVTPRVAIIPDAPTGRVGVFVQPGGERSFVQDRGAALALAPHHLRPRWFEGAELVHIPAYSLLGSPLGEAGAKAADLAHGVGALVTVDLSSSGPLLALGRAGAVGTILAARPDLIFATGPEAGVIAATEEALLDMAPVAVIKRGPRGARILYRQRNATRQLEVGAATIAAADTTGAGDAFDAGFIIGWLAGRRDGLATATTLRQAAAAGNRMAGRHLRRPPQELGFE